MSERAKTIMKILTIKGWLILGLVLLLLASALHGWFKAPTVVTQREYVEVPVDRVVIKIKRVEIPIEKIVTLEKEKVVEKLKLPDWFKQDADKQVLTAGEVPAYKGKTSVVATIDTRTGEGGLIMKQKPLPFFSFENEKEIGLRYGYNSSINLEAQVYGRWTFVRVGSMHGAVYAEMSSEPQAKALLEVSYRW